MIRTYQLFCCGVAMVAGVWAELPPDLPGEEVAQDYLQWALPRDTVAPAQKSSSPAGTAWIDKVDKTWEAPRMSEQISRDAATIPMGKGGIFIPRMTGVQSEPDIEIKDSAGTTAASGEPGRTYNVEPGVYFVSMGSGSFNQRMKQKVIVEEGKTEPVIPHWAGLTIETIDSTALPFRGEYELVRIDEFETFGRGYGANPDLGEVVKTWILKPGIYKILGVGQGYNSLINFVTVRLIPGELTRLLLVQGRFDFKILGGGTVDVIPQARITSNWKYGADIGGNIKFNQETDRQLSSDHQSNASTLFGLLSNFWLSYKRAPYDWQTRIRLDEGFNFTGLKIDELMTDADDFLLISLLIWRFLPWLGPYGRAEINTNFLPRRLILDEANSYFCTLNTNGFIENPPKSFDSSKSFQTRPSFSPVTFNLGMGANIDALNLSFIDTKLRAGFGSSFSRFPRQYRTVEGSTAKWISAADSILYSGMLSKSIIINPENDTATFEFGPQASINGMLRIGRFVTANGELNIFTPIAPENRFLRPDFDLRADVSWRLTRWVTIDYTYTYLLTQPKSVSAQQNKSINGIWLRFSFSSR